MDIAGLRKIAELLHDVSCPADDERFPEHGDQVCRIIEMKGMDRNLYWYREVRAALGLAEHTQSLRSRGSK